LYNLPAYYFSRWLIQMPQQIFFPLLSAVIVYWMVG
jgi:hypothetical protein